MKTRIFSPGRLAAISGVLFFASTTAWALSPPTDFTGVFSGFYAPTAWTTTITGNANYVAPPAVVTDGAPNAVQFIGAIGSGTYAQPATYLDYSIVLPGADPVNITFSYAYFDPVGSGDLAQILDNGVVVANLNSSDSQFGLIGLYSGGDTFDIRLISDVVNLPNILEIAPIPEPSTYALAALSTAAFLLHLRYRPVKR